MKTAEEWIEEYKNDKDQGNGLKRNLAWTTGDLCRAIQKDASLSAYEKGIRDAAEWRSMDSAPKDGTKILVYWLSCKTASIAKWIDNGVKRGWKCDDDECIPNNQHGCLCWQPLPANPTESQLSLLTKPKDKE